MDDPLTPHCYDRADLKPQLAGSRCVPMPPAKGESVVRSQAEASGSFWILPHAAEYVDHAMAAKFHSGRCGRMQAACRAQTPGRWAGASYSAPSRSIAAALARAVSFAGLLTGCNIDRVQVHQHKPQDIMNNRCKCFQRVPVTHTARASTVC